MLSLAAPSGLVGARFSHFQAQLMWTDNSSNEDGFTIERRTTPNGSPTIISRPANTTTYTDPFLNAETTYYYQIKARRSGEPDSAYSNTAQVWVNRLPADPAGWTRGDVGMVPPGGSPGFADETGGQFRLQSDAGPIGAASENFHYAYFPVTGNFTLVGRVSSQSSASNQPLAQAGIMLREVATSPTARNAAITTTPYVGGSQSVRFQWRPSTSSPPTVTTLPYSNTTGAYQPLTFKLVRNGGTISYYYSSNDGATWSPAASQQIPGLAQAVYVGLLVTAQQPGPANRNLAFVDRVAFANNSSGTATPIKPGKPAASAANWERVNLAWTDHSTYESGYTVERMESGSSWVALTPGAPASGAGAYTYVDTTAAPGKTYAYRVTATGVNVPSEASEWVSTPQAPAPAAPTSLHATDLDASSIRLDWTDTAAWEDGFRLEYSTNGGATYTQWPTIIPANTTQYTLPGLSARTRYVFRLTAFNSGGDSPWSNTPSAITGFAADEVTASSKGRRHAVRVWWPDATGEAGYEVWRQRQGSSDPWVLAGTPQPGETYFEDRGQGLPGNVLPEGTAWDYRVLIRDTTIDGYSVPAEVTAATGSFLVIDAPQAEWASEGVLHPIPTKPAVYDVQFISVGTVDNGDMTLDPDDEVRTRAAAATGKDIVLDTEHWPEDKRVPEFGETAVLQTIDRFKQLIAWVRDEWAKRSIQGRTIGLYEVFVNEFAPHMDPYNQTVVNDWRASNEFLGPLAQPFQATADPQQGEKTWQGVDFLVPSHYNAGQDYSEWIASTWLYLEEYRRLGDIHGVGVYPFLHPRWYDPITEMAANYLPTEMWRYELESMRAQADGVAVWWAQSTAGHGEDFTFSGPWYDELASFKNQSPGSAPPAPSAPQIDAYGPWVNWQDSWTGTWGWLVERARMVSGAPEGPLGWVPVTGTFAGEEKHLLDYFARNGTPNYRYRIRAVNAFGSTPGPETAAPVTHRHAARIEAETFDQPGSEGVTGLPERTLNHTWETRWARYNDVDFGNEPMQYLRLRYNDLTPGGTLHFWVVDQGAGQIALAADGWTVLGNTAEIVAVPIEPTPGNAHLEFEVALPVHPFNTWDLVITFQDANPNGHDGSTLLTLDWFKFLTTPTLPPPAPAAPMTVANDPVQDDGGALTPRRPPTPRPGARPPQAAVRRPPVFATRRRRLPELLGDAVDA